MRNIMKSWWGCTRLVIPPMNLQTLSWPSWSSLSISLWLWPTRSISSLVLALMPISRILLKAVMPPLFLVMCWKAFVSVLFYPPWFDSWNNIFILQKVLILPSEVSTVFLPRIKTLVVMLSRRVIASLLTWVLPIRTRRSLPELRRLILLALCHQPSLVMVLSSIWVKPWLSESSLKSFALSMRTIILGVLLENPECWRDSQRAWIRNIVMPILIANIASRRGLAPLLSCMMLKKN